MNKLASNLSKLVPAHMGLVETRDIMNVSPMWCLGAFPVMAALNKPMVCSPKKMKSKLAAEKATAFWEESESHSGRKMALKQVKSFPLLDGRSC